ncbi:hypothetical protein dsx2_1059 [Desulfovibrio sp. X2]|nr:hypothetical protein dsx2_1059 [Desulfovibrio sp. X2]
MAGANSVGGIVPCSSSPACDAQAPPSSFRHRARAGPTGRGIGRAGRHRRAARNSVYLRGAGQSRVRASLCPAKTGCSEFLEAILHAPGSALPMEHVRRVPHRRRSILRCLARREDLPTFSSGRSRRIGGIGRPRRPSGCPGSTGREAHGRMGKVPCRRGAARVGLSIRPGGIRRAGVEGRKPRGLRAAFCRGHGIHPPARTDMTRRWGHTWPA